MGRAINHLAGGLLVAGVLVGGAVFGWPLINRKMGELSSTFRRVAISQSVSNDELSGADNKAADPLVRDAERAFTSGRYAECLAVARDMVTRRPEGYGGYYWSAAGYLRLGEMQLAETAVEAAGRFAGTTYAEEQRAIEGSLARHKAGLAALAAAEQAKTRGEIYRAGERYFEAYSALPYRSDLALAGARLFAKVGDAKLAIKLYAKIAGSPDESIGKEAQKYLDDNSSLVGGIYNESLAQGWKYLAGGDSQQAKDLFESALALDPAFSSKLNLSRYQDYLNTPYVGLAALNYVAGEAEASKTSLKQAIENGMRLDGEVSFPDMANALWLGLCGRDLQDMLHGVAGPKGVQFAANACKKGTLSKNLAQADALFADGLAQSVRDVGADKLEQARQIYARAFAANTSRTELQAREYKASCHINLFRAWSGLGADKPIVGAAEELLKNSAANCNYSATLWNQFTADFSEAIGRISQSRRFSVNVCNDTSTQKIQVAIVAHPATDYRKWFGQAWYGIARGTCLRLPSTFGPFRTSDFYLHASAAGQSRIWWWEANESDVSFCFPINKVDDKEMTGVSCLPDEAPRGFKRITVTDTPDRSGVLGTTFRFRDKPPVGPQSDELDD